MKLTNSYLRGVFKYSSFGMIMSAADGAVLNLFTTLRPLAPRGALPVSLARWWYSFFFQLMARNAASGPRSSSSSSAKLLSLAAVKFY